MNNIYLPTRGPEEWRQLLRNPDRQWKDGCSAKELAYRWEYSKSFPEEVAQAFTSIPDLQGGKILFAVPEYKVQLPGGGNASQNDLFVLAESRLGLVVIMVEGKVTESFGSRLGNWVQNPSAGKLRRLAYLQKALQLSGPLPDDLRYQLLHRSVSAVLTAQRFHAHAAVMLVHSFSEESVRFADYALFMRLFGVDAQIGVAQHVGKKSDVALYCGWVQGTLQKR